MRNNRDNMSTFIDILSHPTVDLLEGVVNNAQEEMLHAIPICHNIGINL